MPATGQTGMSGLGASYWSQTGGVGAPTYLRVGIGGDAWVWGACGMSV